MFDSLKLDVDESVKMEIARPDTGETLLDKDDNPAYLMLLSMESETGKNARHRIQNKMMQKQNKKQTAEAMEEQEIDLISELVTGWYLVDFNGEPVEEEFNKDNVKKLLREASWIREQASEFANDLGNFTQK